MGNDARSWGVEGGRTGRTGPGSRRSKPSGGGKPPKKSSGSASKSVVAMITVGLGVPFATFLAAVGWVIKEHV